MLQTLFTYSSVAATMKTSACIILFLVATIAVHRGAANKCPEKTEFDAEYKSCQEKVGGAGMTDLELWMEHGSCVVKCMMEQFKIVNADGTINREEAASLHKDCKEKHTDWADKIDRVDQCYEKHAADVDPAKPHCSGYNSLVDCMVNEFRQH